MNLSARNARRKRPCGGPGYGPAAMVTVATVMLLLAGPAEAARKSPWSGLEDLFGHNSRRPRGRPATAPAKAPDPAVPLPQPRPAEASGTKSDHLPSDKADTKQDSKQESRQDSKKDSKQDAEQDAKQDAEEDARDDSKEERKDAARPAEPATPAAPEPTACRRALSDEVAIAPSIPDIHGPGSCGGEDLVRLEAVVLADKRSVALTPAATLRCTMALAIADWVRTDVAPVAAGLGSALTALDNFDSYECRGRNRVVGAKLSEHGRANALDVRGFKLADGRSVGLTDRTVPPELRETVLHSVCARFATVLGPGSDWYHEDHIHLDLMERHNNYRICQWNVWEPLPQIAPLLPTERPEEAPPREVASGPGDAKTESASEPKRGTKPAAVEPETKSTTAPDAAEADDRASQPGTKPTTSKPTTTKQRTVKPTTTKPQATKKRR